MIYLTVEEAANIMEIHPESVRRACRDHAKELSPKKEEGRWLIPKIKAISYRTRRSNVKGNLRGRPPKR